MKIALHMSECLRAGFHPMGGVLPRRGPLCSRLTLLVAYLSLLELFTLILILGWKALNVKLNWILYQC